MTQVQVVVSLAAFGFAPRLKAGGRFEASLDCPACHGTFALALPEQAS